MMRAGQERALDGGGHLQFSVDECFLKSLTQADEGVRTPFRNNMAVAESEDECASCFDAKTSALHAEHCSYIGGVTAEYDGCALVVLVDHDILDLYRGRGKRSEDLLE